MNLSDFSAADFEILANAGLKFERLTDAQINDMRWGSIPGGDLKVLADSGLNFAKFDPQSVKSIDLVEVPVGDFKFLANAGLKFDELTATQIRNMGDRWGRIPERDLKVLADSGLNFAKFDDQSVKSIDLVKVPVGDFKFLANAGLKFNELTATQIRNMGDRWGRIPERDLKVLADSGLNFAKFDPQSVKSIDLVKVPVGDFKFLANAGLKFNELTATQIKAMGDRWGRIPGEDFKFLIQAGFDFGRVDSSQLNSINWQNVPTEDLSILANSGIDFSQLNPIDQIDIATRSSGGAFVVPENLSGDEFKSFKNSVSALTPENKALTALLIPVTLAAGPEALLIVLVTVGVIKTASEIYNLLEGYEGLGVTVFKNPLDDGSSPWQNVERLPQGEIVVDSLGGFDLSQATNIDPETFPKSNEFLQNLLDGKYEFPPKDEQEAHVVLTIDNASEREPFADLPLGPISSSDLDFDALRNAANQPLDEGGLTVIGHALTKHAASQRGASPFPPLSGNNANINRIAQQQLEEILNSPDASFRKLRRGGIEARLPDRRGVRFDKDGSLSEFID